MNYKIEVENKEQADEAEKMAATLGYEMDTMFSEKWSDKYCYLLLCKDMSAGFGCELMARGDNPMSFDELRDLVVLKRNSIDDATHENAMYPYVKLSDGWYYFDKSSKWLRSTGGQPSYYDKLKPIEKPMKEYLIPNDGNYKYQKAYPITAWKEWIEIPEGATKATLCNDFLIFWKDDFLSLSKKNGDTDFTFDEKEDYGFVEYMDINDDAMVVWQRHTHPEELPFVDDGPNQTTINAMNEADTLFADAVNHPSHYASSSIECIDAMEAMLTPEQFIGYLRGNAFKYMWRYENKGGVTDLEKAQWYLNKLISRVG